MYFQTSPDIFAKENANKEALAILRGFFSGGEKSHAIEEALECLRAIHGKPMELPAQLFRRAIDAEDEAARIGLATEGLQMIERHFMRYGSNDVHIRSR